VYKIYFWVSYCRPWFLWPETKKLVILFLRIYLIASFLSVHFVSPHRRSHKPRRISTLKTKYHFLWLPPWPQPIVEDGSSIQGISQDGANIEEFKYLSKEKYFWYLPYLSPLCPRTSKRLSMGEEVGTMKILSSKGSKYNFHEKEKEKNWEKKEIEIWKKEKNNMSMCKNKNKVNSPVL
jgi:hypothetical protein